MDTKVDREDVREYYGKVLKTKEDLNTSTCCSAESMPLHIREIMGQLDNAILSKFYGQYAAYFGTIPEEPHCFTLDDHHCLETGRAMLVCGNTAAMLGEPRFAQHFCFAGDRSVHFGLFECLPAMNEQGECIGGGCC